MSSPVILIPRQFKGVTLSKLANDITSQHPNGLPESMTFDFQQLSFIRPAGVVFLSNLFWWLHEHGTTVNLINADSDTKALEYLDDSLFFEQHCGHKIRSNATPRQTTRPLVRIAHDHSHAWLATNLIPWLAKSLSLTEASLYEVKTCLSELFNNIKDHTQFDIGSIFVQHYPNENRVSISLSDFGLGIPEKVKETVPGLSDSAAIVQAVQEGFTSRSTPGNAGLGLDYLLRTVVGTNDGAVTIFSLGGIVEFQKKDGKISHKVLQNVGFCPGTTIDINLRTDLIEWIPQEREELEW
jgi:anti-sigma regulatory factor (Ser/Thr protein kinase)